MLGIKKRDDETRVADRADVNAKRVAITLILAGLLPVIILWAVYAREFRGLNDLDCVDYAQVARNIQAGRGFITSAVRPLAMGNVKTAADVLHMPDMMHAPLFAYAEAIVMALPGSISDLKAFATSALFFLLTIPVLYILAKSMFNPRVAQLAVFAYVISLFMATMVLSGGPATMSAFVFTWLCLLLYRYAQAASPEAGIPQAREIMIRGALCGVLFAVCYLTDYMLLFAFLPVAWFMYVAGKREGRIGLAAFLAAFIVIGGAWMVRNAMVAGNPFFGMKALEIGMNSKAHPGMSLYHSTASQSLLALLQETKGDLPKKLIGGLQIAYSSLPVLGQPYLVAFFIVGLFYSFRKPGVNAVRGMALASLILVALFGSLFLFQLNSLTAFIPVILAFSAAYFVRILTDAKLPDVVTRGITALAAVIMIIPLGIMLSSSNTSRLVHVLESSVGANVRPNVPIVTDRAFETAWYGSRTTIWLPATANDADNLRKKGCLNAVYLSSGVYTSGAPEYGDWRGTYYQVLGGAAQGNFANISQGPLKGFAAFRDMTADDVNKFLGANGVLLTTESASPLSTDQGTK